MELEELLGEYKRKASRQALGKAALCGAIIGLIVNFAAALVMWFLHLKTLTVILISIGSGLGAGLISLFLLFLRFKPDTKKVASMVDRLGLDERVITMLEMEKVDTAMAQLQRDDAKTGLRSVSAKQLKVRISTAVIVLIAVFGVLGVSMTTVSALSSAGLIKSGSEILRPNDDDKAEDEEKPEEELVYFDVNYIAGDGGTIAGETHQRVAKGKDATPVVATPDAGYIFVQWDDGQMNPERWDWSVTEDITVTAIFQKKAGSEGEPSDDEQGEEGDKGEGEPGDGSGSTGEGEDSEDGDGEGEDGEKGDGGENQGGESQGGEGQSGQGAQGAQGDGGETQSQGGQGQGGEPQGGKGEEAEGQGSGAQGDGGEKGDGDGKSDQQGGNGSGQGGSQQGQGSEGGHGGKHDSSGPSSQGQGGGSGEGKPDNNTVMNGGTDYKDAVDYEKGKESVENNDSLPPELKDALNSFLDGMKP